MILHTIVPLEVIFSKSQEQENKEKGMELEYQGVLVQVEPLAGHGYVIRRVISSSPKVFLNPRLQPGTLVDLSDPSIKRV